MKKWDLQSEIKFDENKFEPQELINVLLENREIKTKKEIDNFLDPKLDDLDINLLGINKNDLTKTLKRIKGAIGKKDLIIIFGDYDADGITGAAILWESLNELGANVMPYIPNRITEGYGLSKKGVEGMMARYPDTKMVVTVDNGIVAFEGVDSANSLGLDVIITDHHVRAQKLPNAFSIVHSTKVCGSAVGWFLSRFLEEKIKGKIDLKKHLDLVTIATIADLVPLTEQSRILVKFGLKYLRETKRVGLLSLFEEAALDPEKIGTYEIGHIIAPRLNAMGRLEEGMDSLRLLCTKDEKKAKNLARTIGETNRNRQQITAETVDHAKDAASGKISKKLLFVYHESYQPGVIGLVAGRLTEEYYLPSIVLSKGEEFSKASARSVSGLNIIEFIREASEFLVDAGGHPMAAGFTVETKKLELLEKKLEELAEKLISKEHLIRKLKIDCELSIGLVNLDLFGELLKLEPFGMKNPSPVFLSKSLVIESLRFVGKESKHVKIEFKKDKTIIGGILFNYDKSLDLKIGDNVDVVYSIELNEWNGNKKIELKIRDIKKAD
ncbi:MAG: single-stranded-DNA-specific exonuclease RecJ [Candidatus Levybacteria bacterium]|nr:single-stranded-DNA-specific exonuclease RecJ [Candidatus Levybacteria bacterium]